MVKVIGKLQGELNKKAANVLLNYIIKHGSEEVQEELLNLLTELAQSIEDDDE